MRRALGLAIFTGLIGCSSGSTDPSSGDALAPGSAQGARAETFTASSKFEAQFQVFVDCAAGGAGELVNFSGIINDVFHVTMKGDKFILKFHDQPQGIVGIGETTGARYQATGVTQETTTSGTVGITDSFVNNFKIIGPGPGNNFLIHENIHVTVNANNTVTASHDQFTVDCK
jgi:hypothetical protein